MSFKAQCIGQKPEHNSVSLNACHIAGFTFLVIFFIS